MPRSEAHAPYNFIGLPNKIIPGQDHLEFDRYQANSGTIKVQLRTETSFFTRGNKSSFYNLNGTHTIPGSTLRGMVRSLVEILSYSQISKVNSQKRLRYRRVVDRIYRERVSDQQGIIKALSGYLKREGSGNFSFYHSKNIIGSSNESLQYCRINGNKNKSHLFYEISRTELNKNKVHFYKIYFNPGPLKFHNHNRGRVKLKYSLIKEYSKSPKDGLDQKGTLIITGWMPGKHMQWVIGEKSENKDVLSKNDISNILNDKDYKFQKHIWNQSKKPEGVPCFCLKEGNEIIAISHTPYMRIPYEKTVGDHINYENQTEVSLRDISSAIFGMTDASIAGKVYFEDLRLVNKPTNENLELLKILGSPKPTSYLHYLETNENGKSEDYNGNTKIRGFKQYWHQNDSKYSERTFEYSYSALERHFKQRKKNFQEFLKKYKLQDSNRGKIVLRVDPNMLKDLDGIFFQDKSINEKEEKKYSPTQNAPAHVIGPGNTFEGRIRYDNMTDEELGALLFALVLPENMRHKLGMGKPLGMGTVKIKVEQLIEIKREERYKKLFDVDGKPSLGKCICDEDRVSKFKKAFEEYLKNHGISTPLWGPTADQRMRQLKAMLTWEPEKMKSDSWHSRVSYMHLDDFKAKKVLPDPEEVKKYL